MQRFRPSAPPTADPVPMRIQLTRFEDGKFVGLAELAVTGRAIDGSAQPIAGAIVSLLTLVAQEGGTLELFPVSGWKNSGTDGSFRLVVAKGDRYRASFARKSGDPLQTEEIVLPSRGGQSQRDFVLR